MVITLIDVSGLKSAEDALFHERYLLNSLLASTPDAIYFKDQRGRLIRANDAMATWLGLTDPSAAVGKTALELPNQELALELHRKDEAVLRTGETHHYKLERIVPQTPGERERWDLVTRLPLRDRAGALVGMAAIFRDVTEQKLAEAKIQDSVRRRDQFLAMLSHELRNPLGAIVTATALLKSPRAAANTPRFLGILERQSAQMAALLDDLLEASRVTQNKIALKRRAIDLRSAAREAVDSARGLFESRGLTFTADVDGEPLWIDADPSRLQQIQANLLNNAAKYTPKGGHVSLRVGRGGRRGRVPPQGRRRRSSSGDGRIGLRALRPVKADPRSLGRRAGRGPHAWCDRSSTCTAGPCRCTARAKEKDASSWCAFRSRTRERRRPSRPPVSPARSAGRCARGPRSWSSRIRPTAARRCASCSRRRDSPVGRPRTALKGLALIDEVLPDVAILDVGLPGMDGFEMARRLRADPRHAGMFLIALTGYGQAAERARGREAGFDEHLVKPVNVEEFLRLLAELRGSQPTTATAAAS